MRTMPATGKRLWRWYSVPGPGEFGQRHVGGRQLEAWRRPDVADGLVRSRAESRLLDGRQSRAADRSLGARRSRQSVQRLGRRDRSRHRPAQVALPVHAERRSRLGLVPGRRSSWIASGAAGCASCCCTPIATAIFYVLDRTNGEFLSGDAVRLRELELAASTTKGRPHHGSRFELERERQLLRLSRRVGGATNFQAPSYSPLTGWVYLAVRRRRAAIRQRARRRIEAGKQYIGRSTPTGPGGRPQAERAGSIGRYQGDRSGKPARRCGTSRSFSARSPPACWPPAARCCSRAIRDGNLVALDARSGKYLWHFQTGANVARRR